MVKVLVGFFQWTEDLKIIWIFLYRYYNIPLILVQGATLY